MSDRHKFRVWDGRRYFCENNFILPSGELGFFVESMGHPHYRIFSKQDNFTIEQCTGLRDKNGKLIYEGDIIKVVDGCVHLGKTFEVVGCMIRWEMRDLSNDEYDTLMVGCCVEIIGNIHDDQFREATKKADNV